MDVRPLHTEQDYDWALAEVAAYFETQPAIGTPEADRFDVLSALIKTYEDAHWAIEAPSVMEAIRETMDLRGFTQSDLAAILESRPRASELLSGQRGITMSQAWKLHSEWGIPAEILIQPETRAA